MNKPFLDFLRFFETDVPPTFFEMSASPQLMRDCRPQLKGDLVTYMRLHIALAAPDWEYVDPATYYELDSLLYYKLVMASGCLNGQDYAVKLDRFDRFPPGMRKEMALDALLRASTSDEPEWYKAVLYRAGHNAAMNVVEWRARAGQNWHVSG